MSIKKSDEAHSLNELMPMELFPYAVHILAFDSNRWTKAYRRYRTKGNAKAAAAHVPGDTVLYEFNFATDTWEKLKDDENA